MNTVPQIVNSLQQKPQNFKKYSIETQIFWWLIRPQIFASESLGQSVAQAFGLLVLSPGPLPSAGTD